MKGHEVAAPLPAKNSEENSSENGEISLENGENGELLNFFAGLISALAVAKISQQLRSRHSGHDILYRKFPNHTTFLPNSKIPSGMFYVCSGPK
jgi:hypothetical protein